MKHTVRGLREMIEALDEVSEGPSAKTVTELEVVLANMYVTTQSRVHILSGDLKTTGRYSSRVKRKQWEGEVAYGNPSGGVAYYAIYELHRSGVKPGLGPHDFFSGLEAYDPSIEKAIDHHFGPLAGK